MAPSTAAIQLLLDGLKISFNKDYYLTPCPKFSRFTNGGVSVNKVEGEWVPSFSRLRDENLLRVVARHLATNKTCPPPEFSSHSYYFLISYYYE